MNKRVTDFFKPKESISSKTANNIPNIIVNERHPKETCSNSEIEKQQTVGEVHFHPSKNYKFPKSKQGTRERSCQQHWFNDFPWLHYDERLVIFSFIFIYI